jgi:ElaB/YqjD/DUF883 family membrane-anchored ribosome-binding protein
MTRFMTSEVAGSAKKAAGQLTEKAGAMIHDTQDKVEELSNRAQESLDDARAATSHYVERGREKVESLARTVEGQVKAAPISALLLAAGVGLLMGVIFSRR